MRARDDGATLVEVLVGMTLFIVLASALLGTSLATSKVTEQTRQISQSHREAQLAMERVTRELRQTSLVTGLHGSTGPGDPTLLQVVVDFDGTSSPGPPSTLTYSWSPATGLLTISEGTQSGTLASGVTSFQVTVGSTLWQYDADRDGETTWPELDAHGPPVGNQNGRLDGGASGELFHVDHLRISMVVSDGRRAQTYVTTVDLRNVEAGQ